MEAKIIDLYEIWLPVVGFENILMVSDFGRVKRLPRVSEYIRKGQNGSCFRGMEYLNPHLDSDGYRIVHFRINGESVYKKVHRLVGEAFIPNPLSKPYINHKDFNRENNFVLNLEWATEIENVHYSMKYNRYQWQKEKMNIKSA